MILHGHARLTTDTDLVVDLAAGELSNFLDVPGGLGFKPRVPVELQNLQMPRSAVIGSSFGLRSARLADPAWFPPQPACRPIDLTGSSARKTWPWRQAGMSL
ncbi:MAG: hypothetical protein EA418_00960 [Wenzhouxiangellaceae bacterium]|nr:MAG: hypothetical protein EA418_00960 [Wenzhouxiangellaceae bacterium]